MKRLPVVAIAAAAVLAPALAAAQPAPADWTATAEAGAVFTTGNSRTTTLSGAIKAMRKAKQNQLSLEASGTFAKASTLGVREGILPGATIDADDVVRESKTSAQAYAGKLRYDRFLSEFNSLFVAALAGGDVVAGKDFVGGGQLGYSRLVYKTEQHEVAAEVGYDFSYEAFVDEDAASISIHSARGFVGYKASLSPDTRVEGSVELLGNVTRQSDDVGPMQDLRGTGVASLSTKLTRSVSFAFSLTGKFDNVPAPFSIDGYVLDATNPPETLTLDTTTKASLIVTFL